MISRRQLRIKTLQTLYAYYNNDDGQVSKAEKELLFNVNKAYDLYHSIFILFIDIANYAESRIELARNKRIPSNEDLHPNTRFIDSGLIEQFRNCDQLIRYVELKKISWVNYPELVKELYQKISTDKGFSEFMEAENVTFSDEIRLFTHLLKDVIYPNENLEQALEEQSIYWTDDLEYMISMVIKTLKRFREDGQQKAPLLDLYKNAENRKVPEDKVFAIDLLRKSIANREEYIGYIKSNTKNWDLERIAFMDILIMQMAIAEFVGFESIPTKVTLNEYLEISKIYSTNKSNVFINGVLDKVACQLKENNKIRKSGRGLIGEFDGEQKK
ncbi:MAG: transcription antitermination factor NusB [Bacteroidales bacterium]|nr:transcription antitermination factor NusB [Bacteroidales bacterium]